MTEDYGYVKRNLDELTEELAILAKRAGRDKVTLVCVTKSGSDEELSALVKAGASDIGENRPQELRRRGELLSQEGLFPTLHEIGNLQRKNVKLIIDRVALIHSLDSLELAAEINKRAAAIGRKIPVLAEINSAMEEAKGGVSPKDAREFCQAVKEFENLELKGLMTMGPPLDNPELMRPYFKLTREIFDSLAKEGFFTGEPILSMGMSDSYAVAIEEGATLVRIGRRLFKK